MHIETIRNRAMIPKVKYTIKDTGCYVDGARGIYATDAIMRFAHNHGMPYGDSVNMSGECDCDDPTAINLWSECEFASDHEDEANEFMNDKYAVDGACWGSNENSDWGLWEIESD